MYEISMTALTVLFLSALGYGLACHVLELWQKVRPRQPATRRPAGPAPKPGAGAPAPAPPPEYRLRLNLDGMELRWSFGSAAERRTFNIGFREGVEYHVEALKRKGCINRDAYVEFSRLKAPQSRRRASSESGRT